MELPGITIIGRGNVGMHLYNALKGKARLAGRSEVESTANDTDVYILCLPDTAIPAATALLKQNHTGSIVVHTSGSVPMIGDGVFYPLQTFTKNVEMDYVSIPFLIEGRDEKTEQMLYDIAREISSDVRICDSATRARLHLAAVFASNFSNYLWAKSDKLLKDTGYGFEILIPLLRQSLDKLSSVSPHDAQTGPARRHDIKTIEKHLAMLEDHPDLAELYSILSNGIINDYND